MIKKLTIRITDEQKAEFLALRRAGRRPSGELQLQRIINLHFADEYAAGLTGSPTELDEKEAALVLIAGKQMLARDPKSSFAEIVEEMKQIRRTRPPEGIPKRHPWILRVFGASG